MADILGPSGQPIRPNPFTSPQSQQDLSANVSINTQSAQQAMADFQKSLDSMMKSFGGSWEKVSKDSMAAQERFYKYVGDKDKERQIALTRYSKEAISAINEETRAKISAFDQELQAGKKTQEEIRKAKIETTRTASKQIENIENETSKKLAQSRGIGGLVRGGTEALAGMGGPIGSSIAGIGNVLMNPEVAIPGAIIGALIELGNTQAAFAKTGSQLSGAGLRLGAGAGAGLGVATGLFGGPLGNLGQALSADEQRSLIAQMSGSRTMIDQTRAPGGFGAVRGNLGLFANILPDAAKEMEVFTDATKNLGMSQKDISDTFVSTRVNAEHLKVTQLDAIKAQMDMQKALRNITNDGTVAASVLSNITDYLQSIGASETEKARIGVAVAQAGSNLSLPQIAGMFAFTHGGKMPTPGDIFGTGGTGEGGLLGNKGGGVFGLMGQFLTTVGNQFKDPTQRMFAANQLQQQFLPGLRLQDIPHFFQLTNDMMQGKVSGTEFGKQFKELEGKTPQVAAAEGIQRLASIVDPIHRLENVFTNFWTMLDDRINKLIDAIHHPFGGGPTIDMSKPNIRKQAALLNKES